MMKKTCMLSVLLSLLIVIALLGGCASNSSPSPTVAKTVIATSAEAAATPAEAAATPASGYTGTSPVFNEMKTISWLCTNKSSFEYNFEGMKWMQEIIKRANVKLNMECLDATTYADVFNTRMAARANLPDVIQMDKFDTSMSYIQSGLIADITQAYDKYGFNLKRVLSLGAYTGVDQRIRTPDGKLYYVPTLAMAQVQGLMMNKNWLDKIGKNFPTTTDELYNVLSAMKDVDFNGNGKQDEIPLFLRPSWMQKMGCLWGIDLNSGYTVGKDGTVSCAYTSSEYLDFLTYFNRLYAEGLLYNQYSTSTFDIQKTLMSNNQVGSTYHFLSNSFTYYNGFVNPKIDLNTDDPFYLPVNTLKGPFGDQCWFLGDMVVSDATFAITSQCKDVDGVFCFLDYLYSDEASGLILRGIKNEDYTINDDGSATMIGESVDSTVQNRFGAGFGGFPRYQQYQLSNLLLKLPSGGKIIYDIIDAQNDKAWVAQLSTSHYTTAEESDTLNKYSTDLNTYFAQMLDSFVTGMTPLSGYNEYVDKVKAMNVDKVIEVYQAGYDRSKNK